MTYAQRLIFVIGLAVLAALICVGVWAFSMFNLNFAEWHPSIRFMFAGSTLLFAWLGSVLGMYIIREVESD